MLVAVAVVGAAVPAMADPPPHTFKAQYEMRLHSQDGRGETMERSAMPAERPQVTRQEARPGSVSHGAPIQMKSEYALRMQNGDNREASNAKSVAARPVAGTVGEKRPGSFAHGAPIRMKTEFALRLQGGDNREGGPAAANKGDVASRSAASAKTPVLSLSQRHALCKQAGVCLYTEQERLMGEADEK
jgi:hypothetical protein